MSEQIVIKTWWVLTLGMVAVSAMGCLLVAYRGLFDLVAARWGEAGSCEAAAVMLGAAAYFLCRYRGDIVGD
jgi:hypothetical protein